MLKNLFIRLNVFLEKFPFYSRFRSSMAAALYLGIALILFLACVGYRANDPAWSQVGSHEEVGHFLGSIAAYGIDLSYSFLGYGVYTLCFCLFSFSILRWKEKVVGIVQAWGVTLMVVATAILSAPFMGITLGGGGIVGAVLEEGLLLWMSLAFVRVVSLSLFFLGMTFVYSLSWSKILAFVGRSLLYGIIKGMHRLLGRHALAEPEKEPEKETEAALEEDAEERREVTVKRVIKPLKKQVEKKVFPKNPMVQKKGLPALDLLGSIAVQTKGYSSNELQHLSQLVEQRLAEFGVKAEVKGVLPGPVITRFELDLAAGIKVSKVSALAKDLARALSVVSVRVVEIIPGKSYIGLEIPNTDREMVLLYEILSDTAYQRTDFSLSLALGKDIEGQPVAVDLAKMPHLLVAGTTGSGKSVGINAMLLSLLYKAGPAEIRLILIDPKMLELSVYDGIPHLLTPVVTDMKDAASALRWCVAEMEHRYQLMSKVGVRHLAGFNNKIKEAIAAGEPIMDPLVDLQSGVAAEALEPLPFIVVVIDEFADMIMVVGKKVEELIARIAQKARAAGIHLILATQRPSVDVITGLIKANIPTRIAFQVSSRIDSRTILDQQGAEQLLGHGDMLYLAPGTGLPVRVHGAYVSDDDVHKVANYWRSVGSPDYVAEVTQYTSGFGPDRGENSETDDPLYDEAVRVITDARKASISLVQRRLKIGYNRAARLLDAMEQEGVISPMQSNGQREVVAGSMAE
jgi:DNA segregation ATPase FtsK/SpoIIIE, S-DNA-T family